MKIGVLLGFFLLANPICNAQSVCESGYIFIVWNSNFKAQYRSLFIKDVGNLKEIRYKRTRTYERPKLQNGLRAIEDGDDLKYCLQLNNGLFIELNPVEISDCLSRNNKPSNKSNRDSILKSQQSFFFDSIYSHPNPINYKSYYERDTMQFLVTKVNICYSQCQLRVDKKGDFNFLASPFKLEFVSVLTPNEHRRIYEELRQKMKKTYLLPSAN